MAGRLGTAPGVYDQYVVRDGALDVFHPLTAEWFARAFAEPTDAQRAGWPAIAAGEHTLLFAPTGSGKTLAAFLWALDQIMAARLAGAAPERVLYVSPLKALNYDVERNLDVPLAGLRDAARRAGLAPPEISVAVRTGDTPQSERARMLRHPPDVLITTPESLFLMLTSRARTVLEGVRTVIVDEIHSVAATKRGAHLALSLERLDWLVAANGGRLQRIGLSATQRPLSEIARFLGGQDAAGVVRPVTIKDAGHRTPMELQVIVPVEDMAALAGDGPHGLAADTEYVLGGGGTQGSIWPTIYPELVALIQAHTSTLVFVNNRRLAERLALRINELAGSDIARAHHGSLAREQRTIIEEQLKAGELPALVATSSLELGIDMGAIDLVIQVESPRSVAPGIQPIGRSGHHVGGQSKGRIFPKFRGDLLECAAVVARMQTGEIEHTTVPRLPLDVLAQQLVAVCADEPWALDDLMALTRGAYPFSELSREQLENTLDMLVGRYPSDNFAELRPRLIWDRMTGLVRGRPGARQLVVTNAGTIPDRGMFGVWLADGSSRVGELDEEMVYEARAGQTFLLGASSWRIEQITRDRVVVSPAPGAPGTVPFWRGDDLGRPVELGAAVGKLARELVAMPEPAARARLAAESAFDVRAAANLVAYLHEQAAATGTVPSDRAIVIERFRDEIGDWRMCVLTPFGSRLHAPWAMAMTAAIREQTGQDAHGIWTDDGIAVHLPDADLAPDPALALMSPEELDERVLGELARTALFGARFRENAARALLIPRRRPGQRTPLWQQRLKAASLLEVARQFGSFPIILETYRECLNDWFDLPALRSLLTRIATGEVGVVDVETPTPSPFAANLLFAFVASYMYEGDAPVAERRAQALTLDRDLLRELLGREELRELIDPEAIAQVHAELQGTALSRRARTPDELHDLLRRIGDLSLREITARVASGIDAADWCTQLVAERRAARVRIAGEERVIDAHDAGRYRDALGVMPPAGLPGAFLEPTTEALIGLAGRFAATRGPFVAGALAERFGITRDAADTALGLLEARGVLLRGELVPGGSGTEWCDPDVLRRLRRASLAMLRREVEPADPEVLGRFLPAWHRIDHPRGVGGPEGVREVIRTLQGIALPAAQWETEVFPRRLGGYSPAWIDELAASGEIAWIGAGGSRVAIYLRDELVLFGPTTPVGPVPADEISGAVRDALDRGALFWDDLNQIIAAAPQALASALWGLAWAGEITNDLWAPLRAPRKIAVAVAPPRTSRRGALARAGRSAARAVRAGRWSRTDALVLGERPAPAARRRALAELLLERHGLVTRGGVRAEALEGGFAGIYPEFTQLEVLGACRRGYFVEGLGGAQFALAGAIERVRDLREARASGHVLVLGAADPAQPYGAALAWPASAGRRTPARSFGAQVVLIDGTAVLYVERGGRSLVTLGTTDPEAISTALAGLAGWVQADRARRLVVGRIDGIPVEESDWHGALVAAGFRQDLKGLLLRA